MNFTVYKDDVSLRLDNIVANLNRLSSPVLRFSLGKSSFSIPGTSVSSPTTYQRLNREIRKEASRDLRTFLFTEKPYDNNYFFDSPDKRIIVSLYAWDHLTALPRNNGAVYFVCTVIVRTLNIGSSHGRKTTGCVNDFWGNKSAIDLGMRSAFICDRCISSISDPAQRSSIPKLISVLDDVSAASRAGLDICDYWDAQ